MTTKSIREKRIIDLNDGFFKARVVISDHKLLSLDISRRYYSGPRLFFNTADSLETLRAFLDDIYDVLEENNLAGEVIETI